MLRLHSPVQQHQQTWQPLLGQEQSHVRVWPWCQLLLTAVALCFLLPSPCSSHGEWIRHPLSWCRQGEWTQGSLKAASSELQRMLKAGSRKGLTLFAGSYSAGSWV